MPDPATTAAPAALAQLDAGPAHHWAEGAGGAQERLRCRSCHGPMTADENHYLEGICSPCAEEEMARMSGDEDPAVRLSFRVERMSGRRRRVLLWIIEWAARALGGRIVRP